MQSFEFYFFLVTIISIFEQIEILNTELQKSELCVNESHSKVKIVADTLALMRDSKFESIWSKVTEGVNSLGIGEPKLQRPRKVPKRLDSSTSQPHVFASPQNYYRKIYLEIFDKVLMSLGSRFATDTIVFLNKCEDFVSTRNDKNISEIVTFYNNTKENLVDFSTDRLLQQRNVFLDSAEREKKTISSLKDVVAYLKENSALRRMLYEYTRFIILLLTIPGSSCSNERSFSVLRRLKNYLRSTMLQDRLNDIALIHIHQDMAEELDLDLLMNEFINLNNRRKVTFALSK